jgi:hypothetical protein
MLGMHLYFKRALEILFNEVKPMGECTSALFKEDSEYSFKVYRKD